MSSTSSSKQTRKRTVTNLKGTKGSTAPDEHVLKVTRAAALVEIYIQGDYDGPDTLVLRSTDGENASDRTYWKEIAVQEQEQSGSRIECAFTLSEHEGTAKEKADLKGRRYTLAWRPIGEAEEEILLLENAEHETVWSVGEGRHVAAGLVAARFRECPDVSFPGPDPLSVPDLPEPLADAHEPYDDEGTVFPVPDPESAQPVKSRSSEGGGGESSGSLPPGERWVYLFRYVDRGEDEPDATDRLGAYRATESGTYQRGTFGEDGTLTAEGSEQSDVLLPSFTAALGTTTVFARLSLVGVPKGRADRMNTQLSDFQADFVHTLTPLHLQQGTHSAPLDLYDSVPLPVLTADVPIDPEPYLENDSSVPGCPMNLVGPLGVAECRLREAEAAQRRLGDWEKKMEGAGDFSALVGEPCYDPIHQRGHLQSCLARETTEVSVNTGTMSANARSETVKEGYHLQREWSPFSPDAAEGDDEQPPHPDEDETQTVLPTAGSETLLGQFLYGLRCQRAYLEWNRDRATRSAERALDVSLFRHLVLDGCAAVMAAGEGEDPPTDVESLRSALYPMYGRLLDVGGGRQLVRQIPDGRTDKGLFGRMTALSEEDFGELLQPMEEAAASSPADLASGPLYKGLYVLAQGSTTALHQLAIGASSVFLASDLGVAPKGRAPVGAAVLGAKIMKATHGSFDVDVTRANGQTTALTYRAGGAEDVVLSRVSDGPMAGRWKLEVRGKVRDDFVTASKPLAETAEQAGQALSVMNLILAAYTTADHARRDEVDLGDALGVGAALSETAQAVLGTQASKTNVGRLLVRTGPWLSALEGAWGVYESLMDVDERGRGTLHDPDELGAVGTAMMAGGGALLGGAAGFTAAALSTGGTLVLVGGLALWLTHIQEQVEEREADPLTDWLPTHSLWGREHTARGTGASRDHLFNLVRPGQDEDADPARKKTVGTTSVPKALASQAAAFTETAFSFPTEVQVRDAPYSDQDPRTGLIVAPHLGYLPAYGTLMVDLRIIPAAPTLDEKNVQCALHYVDVGEQTRYLVKPPRDEFVEPLRVQPDMPLPEQAEFEEWPRAHAGTLNTDGSTTLSVPRLPIHVGGVWTAREHDHDDNSRVQRDNTSVRTDAMDRAEYEKSRFTVEADAIVQGPDGVGSILESGAFWVRGTVHFSPLCPFQPNPVMSDGEDLTAEEEIRFQYS